jgi:hypothetical protein
MDPSVGRFITADPFGGFMFEPLSLHKYLYANADPVNKIDPSGYFSIQELATTQTIQGIISSVNWKCIGTTILRNALKGLVRGMIFGGIDAWLGGGTIEDIVNGILSGGITGFLLGPLAMINRLRPVFIAFGLGSGIKGVYDSIKNGEYDQAAFRATFVILTLWELKKGVWDKRACFTEETLVLTEDGYKQIKDIQEEDFVYSENVETGEKGLKKVAKVFVREVHKLIHVYVDGEEINTTDTHPFWVEGKGWIEAGELKTGDVLRLYTGELKTVEKVEIEVFDRPVKVYNFEVEDWHTYYVTEQGVLVHNAKNYDGNGKTGVGNKGTPKTGTVYDNIKITQPVYEGTQIPKSFEITTANGQKMWVHPNATEHMFEYVTRNLNHSRNINSQQMLSSFESALNQAVKNGVQFDKMIKVGNWEFKFAAPRGEGLLPVVKHAQYIP